MDFSVFLAIGFLSLFITAGAQTQKHCLNQTTTINIEATNQETHVIKCKMVQPKVVSNVRHTYRLYAVNSSDVLSEKRFDIHVESHFFTPKDLKEGVAGKHLYCTYQYTDASTNVSCVEVKSVNTLKMEYVCPKKRDYEIDSSGNLTMALLGPQEFYCINNGTPCPVTATVKFRKNLIPCRTMSLSPKSTATNGLTPALLVKDSCTSQFSSTNWESGIDIKLFKNANSFVQKESAEVTIDTHFEMLQGSKLESLKKCDPVTIWFQGEYRGPKICASYTDPHIYTFSLISITSMAPGNYLMYKHRLTHTEVHTRQRQCSEYDSDSELGCNQAVSIRSRNNVVVYEVNDGLLKEKRLMNDTSVPMNIKTVTTQYSYEVYLSNGDVVYVFLENTKFSLTVQIFSLTENLNNIEGFCSLKSEATATKDMEALRVRDNTAANFEYIQERTISAGVKNFCKCGEGTENCVDTFKYYHCEHHENM